jgi:CRISPR-associated endonuclease/helicase Cas3
MPISPITLADCWAKTFPKGHPSEGHPALTVRDHCLIVGAVAEAVLGILPAACRGLPPTGSATFTAAHDIGKISPGFLRKCIHSRFAQINGSQNCCGNHALISQAFLASLPEMQEPPHAIPLAWAFSAGGHHGSYPTSQIHNNLGKRYGPNESDHPWPGSLRRELLVELLKTFGNLPSESTQPGSRVHWLTGFVTFCDWIGSNTDWFPLPPTFRDHATPESARAGARAALDLIGWHRRSVTLGKTFPELFAKPGSPEFSPRLLQETLIALVDQPGLYIVEAPMGMGKTEAALAAAYHRWTEGAEAGLYFALPTQLTSNRIHDRVSDFLKNVTAGTSHQTLVHGNAWLSEDRFRSFSPAPTTKDDADATEVRRWFTSSRKPLLAPFGTGTIDQALMACISAKHSALRLFALSGKVVVIDEVHSYDPYTSALVDKLVLWLRETGCTVIVLSATLTAKRRQEMIAAVGATENYPQPDAYPLITKVVGNTATAHPVDDPALRETKVGLCHLGNQSADFIEAAARAAETGACVLIIRNSVRSAQETHDAVKFALQGDHIPVALLHSRFPHFQRQENERDWMEKLGANPAQRPAGCVLVATQVVEQSVDIDADLLITDLAPTDLLLQRLGRLHRHPRPRPAGFDTATCWILHPTADWDADPKSIKSSIGSSGFIYPPISLYHAGEIWRQRDSVILPTDIRPLLESSLPEPLPAGAAQFATELKALTGSMLLKAGYTDPFQAPDQSDDEGVQTRYNPQPSKLLVLLKRHPQTQGYETPIVPLNGEPRNHVFGRFDYDLAKHLHENAVRVPAYLVRAAADQQPAWLAEHVRDAVLAIIPEDSTRLEIVGGENLSYALHYHPATGIAYEKLDRPAADQQDSFDDDSWF